MTDTHGFAPTEKMLTPTSLAEMLAISDRHLTNLRREDATFPAPVMLGKLPRWSPATIRRWMDPQTSACTKCSAVEQEAETQMAPNLSASKSRKTRAVKAAHHVD